MYIKLLDEKALQKVYKKFTVLVFNERTRIITDGIFTIKNYSTVKFTKDILSALFPKIKNIRECKYFNIFLNKPEPLCYEKTCIIIEYDKKKNRIYKNSDNIIVIDDKYTQYFPLYLYAHKDFNIICYNEKTREESNFIVMGVKYYDTLTEAMENSFLIH